MIISKAVIKLQIERVKGKQGLDFFVKLQLNNLMKTRRNLYKLKNDFVKKINRLEMRFRSALFSDPTHDKKECLEYCVIELMNKYRAFNRALLASSMLGAKTISGSYVRYPGIKDEYDFILKIFSLTGKRVNTMSRTWESRDEPAWEARINDFSTQLNLQNAASINSAFTCSSFYKEIKTFRNYCCHRSKLLLNEARTVAIRYLISGNTIESILLTPKNDGQLLFLDWINSCKIYAELATA